MNHRMHHNNSITLPLGSFFTRLPSFKLLSISLLFVTILSACGPLSKAGLSTQSSEQNRPEALFTPTTEQSYEYGYAREQTGLEAPCGGEPAKDACSNGRSVVPDPR